MTELLERVLQSVRKLPDEEQDDIARLLAQFVGEEDEDLYQLTPGEEAFLAESLAEAERGEFATDDEVRAIWAKHGL